MDRSWKLLGRIGLRYTLLVGVMSYAAVLLSDSKGTAVLNSGRSIRFVSDETYKEECASCHLGFLPGFLPPRAWKKLMDGLADHFGENASLDADMEKKVRKYLLVHAAGTAKSSVRSKKIAKLESTDDFPIRITETVFWQRKHFAVKEWVWQREKVGSKARCEACHTEAEKGIYSEYTVVIPE